MITLSAERCPVSGKIPYDDEVMAMFAVLLLGNKRDHKPKSERDYYECHACGKWHLTSERRRV